MSGTTVDDKIVKWMTKMLSSVTENGRVSRVALYHTIEGMAADRCIELGIEEGQDIAELSQELWETAEHDASTRDFGMPQRYVIRLFDTPQGDDHLAVYPFTIRGRATSPYSDSGSEPANERGLLAQLMRATENQNRLLVHNAAITSQELDRAIKRARDAEDRELITRKLHEELQDRAAEREIEKAKKLMSAKRTDELIGQVIPLLPLLFTKLLQGLAPPAAQNTPQLPEKSPLDAEIEKFLASLSPEEMRGIMGSLRGMNQLTMVEIWKSYQTPANLQASTSREMSVGKFLKSLSPDETSGILRALTETHRPPFIAIYDRFAELYTAEQKGMPTVLQDPPEDEEPTPH